MAFDLNIFCFKLWGGGLALRLSRDWKLTVRNVTSRIFPTSGSVYHWSPCDFSLDRIVETL